jgi:hypothetical protein
VTVLRSVEKLRPPTGPSRLGNKLPKAKVGIPIYDAGHSERIAINSSAYELLRDCIRTLWHLQVKAGLQPVLFGGTNNGKGGCFSTQMGECMKILLTATMSMFARHPAIATDGSAAVPEGAISRKVSSVKVRLSLRIYSATTPSPMIAPGFTALDRQCHKSERLFDRYSCFGDNSFVNHLASGCMSVWRFQEALQLG